MSRVRATLVHVLGAPLATHHPAQRADAIIVLGAALFPDGSLPPPLEERVRAGVAVFQRGLAPKLCMTGGKSPRASHDETEARAMAAFARELGVPDGALEVEDASGSTWENAHRCAALLFPKGIRRVWIVTQPFHLRRAVRHFRRAGFEPLGWHIENSLQVRDPRWGLRRVLREYISWAKSLLLWR